MSTINYQLMDYQNTAAYSGLNFSVIGGTTWSSTGVVFPNIYDTKLSVKLGNLNDTFEFKIDNNNNASKDLFRIQDKMQFNLLLDGASAASSNVIFTGLMKYSSETVQERGTFLTVSGVSFDEMVTNGMVFIDTNNVTVFQFFNQALQTLQNYTKPNDSTGQFFLGWNAGNPLLNKYSGESGGDQVFNGAALPPMLGGGRVSYFNKTLDQLLNIFLNEQYTGDGRYYWYVNSDKELVIRKMTYNPKGTLIEGTDNIVSIQLSVDTKTLYNTIVVQAGSDPAGKPISTFYQDPMLSAQYGLQPFLLKTNDANTLIQQELKINPSSFNSTSNYPTGYPYTCSWKDAAVATVTATTNADYIAKFRTEVKRRGYNNAMFFVSAHSRGMRQFIVELPPTVQWHLGDIVQCTFPSYNIQNLPIRVYQIDYGYDNVVLTLKEEFLYAI